MTIKRTAEHHEKGDDTCRTDLNQGAWYEDNKHMSDEEFAKQMKWTALMLVIMLIGIAVASFMYVYFDIGIII